MLKKAATLCCVALLASVPAIAHADEIFSLTDVACSSGCSVIPAGTVTLSDAGTNEVLVTVSLAPDYSFRDASDSNHHALVFDLSGVTGVTATNISNSAFTFDAAPGSYKDAGLGAGNFQYAFEDGSSSTIKSFSFDLNGTGLGLSSFVPNGTDYFGVDVTGLDEAAGIGLTGNIGAIGPSTPLSITQTPEPSSLMLLGTGILGAAGLFRRRMVEAINLG
jgi:PEP-CTERM motif